MASLNRLTRSGFWLVMYEDVKYAEMHRFGSTSANDAMARQPLASAVETKGSTTKMACTRPASSAAAISGKANSTKFTLDWSPPDLRTISRTDVSTIFFNVLDATVLPSRSLGVLIVGSLTTSAE